MWWRLLLASASCVNAGLFDGWTKPASQVVNVDARSASQTQRGAPPIVRSAAWVEAYDPRPLPSAIVTHGPARFTVLTPHLIRMEWSPRSPPRFHDAGSFFAVHRAFPPVPFQSQPFDDGAAMRITTTALELVFDPRASPRAAGFTHDNLHIVLRDSGRTWHAGDEPRGSLHGTIRTLDRVGATVSLACSSQPAYANDSHCEEGVVSRDGWAVLVDSMGPRWDTADFSSVAASGGWPWVTGPAELPATPDVNPRKAECAPAGYERFECVWGNVVDEGACRARGCCYDPEAAAIAHGKGPEQHLVPWCFWPTPPEGEAAYTDLYFFGHGADFRGALRDFTLLGGRVPLMPRWSLGPFFSRWYAFADHEERNVLASHTRNGIPLDVQVLDTDWHMGWTHERSWPAHPPRYPDGPPPNANAIQWTGWDVNTALLPAAKRLHDFLHARGVATAWNLHLPPYVQRAGGVQYTDSVYLELARALGFDGESGMPILGDYSNQSWVEPFFRLAVKPVLVGLEVDAAWPDWQQGEWTRMLGLPPTPWLSYLFASAPAFARAPLLAPPVVDAARPGGSNKYPARSFVLNRWGGLGAHRYPVGFSGDAETTWEVLRLQVLITATAANVAFQWSHDIGGFAGLPEPEVMTRWVQLGTFSPILRPHCAGRGGNSRDIWRFTWDSFEIMRDYFRLRARLVPYLYTAQRVAYETGVVPVHPLYYDFPRAADAFTDGGLHQYCFGDAMWVAPIAAAAPTAPADAGLAVARVWFPPGDWIEWGSWQQHSAPSPGGAAYERRFALDETPIYSRPGTIVPMRTLPGSVGGGEGDAVGTAVDVPDAMTVWVLPLPRRHHDHPLGVTFESSARIYDDDGVSMAYALDGAHRWTNVSCTWSRVRVHDRISCTIAPGGGPGFAEMPRSRRWTLRFLAVWPPASVAINGEAAPLAAAAVPDVWGDGAAWPAGGLQPAWAYAGMQASLWVHCGGPRSIDEPLTVAVDFPTKAPSDDEILTSAIARKISRAQKAKHTMNLAWSVIPADVTSLLSVAGAGARVEDAVATAHEAAAATTDLAKVPAIFEDMYASVRGIYGGLADDLREAAAELEAVKPFSGDGVHHLDPLATMAGLIANALA